MPEALLRIAGSVAVLAAGWWAFGPFGLVMAAPVVALLGVKVVMQAASGGFRAAKALALGDVDGRYYAFRGRPIAVVEDIDGWRWLRAADLRRLLPGLPADRVLVRIEPQRAAPAPDGALHLRSDAVLQWLSRAQADDAVRLKVWVDREVHFPSPAVRRARAGAAATRPADLG